MSALPIPCMVLGGVFYPVASHRRYVADTYGEGEIVTFTRVEERSHASHGHYFALINQAWANLPEDLAERFPSQDHLRKWCLIKAGWRDERATSCATVEEAERLVAFVRPIDDYAIVIRHETAVIVWTAKSQSMADMGKADFQKSKDDVLRVLSELIGTDVTTLHNAA